MIAKIITFLKHDIWRVRLRKAPPGKSFGVRVLRVVILALRGFDEDRCQLRASALTIYTLMSIVPVLALAFGIAKGFGFQDALTSRLLENFHEHEQVVQRMIDFAHSLLDNTHGGVVSGIGIIFLFWTVIKVFGQIEGSFNDIWGLKQGRPLIRKLSDYLSISLVCPFLFITSSSMTVFISSQIGRVIDHIPFIDMTNTVVTISLKSLSLGSICFLFSFIYVLMPNTKVRWSAGILAGIIAGCVYQCVQIAVITLQVYVTKLGAIYGSFAVFPLFLIWLQLSWLVVLFGAELAFAMQHVETYEFEPDCLGLSPYFKKKLTLMIFHYLTKRVGQEHTHVTIDTISHDLDIPTRLVHQIVFDLEQANLVSKFYRGNTDETYYQPAYDTHDLTIHDVLSRIEKNGVTRLPVNEPYYQMMSDPIDHMDQQIQNLKDNVFIKDLHI